MNKTVRKVQKLSDHALSVRLLSASGVAPAEGKSLPDDLYAIAEIKSKLTGSRGVPPTGQIALYFDALLAVTRGKVLAILATPRHECEALLLALEYKTP